VTHEGVDRLSEHATDVARLAVGGFAGVALLLLLIGSFQPPFLGMLVVEALVIAACAHAYVVLKRRDRGPVDVHTPDAD
jgi:hypothetical protein